MDDPDRAIGEALPLVAARLQERPATERGLRSLREELAGALQKRVGFMSTAVAVDYVRPQGWSETSVAVDVTVRGRIAGWQSVVCACSWCAEPEELALAAPALLAATCAARDRGAYAYLIVAAPDDLGPTEAPLLGLLAEGEQATLRLLADRLDSGGSVQATVPGRLSSLAVAEAWLTVDGVPWFLRAGRVDPAGGDIQLTI